MIATALACAIMSLAGASADDSSWKPPVSPDQLPVVKQLPELLRFADGRQLTAKEEWQQRRCEIKAILQHYAYGRMPPRPDAVTAADYRAAPIRNCEGTEERMTLVIGSQHQLRMRIAIYRPATRGKLPVIVREEHALGHIEEVPAILQRNYMFVEFAREDLDPDQPDVIGSAQQAYPDCDWGTLAVWAWGAMRVVDYLETRRDVKLSQIAVAGHSRGGKMAMIAGAYDERFALVAANGSGSGGAGCFRIQPDGVETLELITRPERFGYWFHPRLRWFAGREDRLPFDQHFLKALVAPRILLCTEARDDLWANPVGNRRTSAAADDVFRLLQHETHNGLHFRDGNHDLTAADWNAILDFADWHFRNRPPEDKLRFFLHRAEED